MAVIRTSEVQSYLFGERRGELGDCLEHIARSVDGRIGPANEYACFEISKTLGSLASGLGCRAAFSGGRISGEVGMHYKVNYQHKTMGVDDLVYAGYPEIQKMLKERAGEASGTVLRTNFLIKIGIAMIAVKASHSIALLGTLEGATEQGISCSTGARRSVTGATMNDTSSVLDADYEERFRQIAAGLPGLSAITTRPYSLAFAEAIAVIAPGVSLVPSVSEV